MPTETLVSMPVSMTEDVYSNVFVMWICAARAARHWMTRSSRALWGCLLMLAVRRTSRDDGFTPTLAVNSSIASSLQCYPAMETIALPVRLFVHFRIVERLGNPLQPGVFNDQDEEWKTSMWALAERVRGMWYFLPSVLGHCWLGDRKCIRPVKS